MLVKDGCAFAVAREDGGVVGQAEEAFPDACAERFVIAALQVGAPNAAIEERVAGEHPAFDFGIEAYAAFGVAGRANHLQGTFPNLDDFVVFQESVGHFASAVEGHSEEARLPLGAKELVFHALVGRHGNAVSLLDGGIAENMVDMAMRVDGHQRLEPLAVDEAKKLIFLARRGAAGVDDDTFLGRVVVNDIGVFRERIENELFELEHSFFFCTAF